MKTEIEQFNPKTTNMSNSKQLLNALEPLTLAVIKYGDLRLTLLTIGYLDQLIDLVTSEKKKSTTPSTKKSKANGKRTDLKNSMKRSRQSKTSKFRRSPKKIS